MYVYMYVCMYVCMYVHNMYVCMYVCMCIYSSSQLMMVLELLANGDLSSHLLQYRPRCADFYLKLCFI